MTHKRVTWKESNGISDSVIRVYDIIKSMKKRLEDEDKVGPSKTDHFTRISHTQK